MPPVLDKIPYVERLFNRADGKPVQAEKAARDAQMQVIHKRLSETEAQLGEMRKNLGEQHPQVLQLQAEQDTLKQALADLSAADGKQKNNKNFKI